MLSLQHYKTTGLVMLGLSGISQAMAGTATTAQQYGSYVILGQSPKGENVAIARTVIDPQLKCPTVSSTSGDTSINMITRNNPFHFPVMVCELAKGISVTD